MTKKFYCLWEKYKDLKIVNVPDEYIQNENQIIWKAKKLDNREYWARKNWSKNYGNLSSENEFCLCFSFKCFKLISYLITEN